MSGGTEDRTLRKPTDGGDATVAVHERRVSLVAFHRDGARVAALAAGTPVVVGRSFPADFVVDDRGVSRQHARFTLGDAGVLVEDLGSTNGTFVNGAKVGRAVVRPGDEVRVGDASLAIHAQGGRSDELRGVEGYDRFVAALEDELQRARTFRRPFALVVLRATSGGEAARVSRWATGVLRALRPVDRAALHGPDAIMVALPETARDAAARFAAGSLIAMHAPGVLRAGVAGYPEDGATVDELLAAARGALESASQPGRTFSVAGVADGGAAMPLPPGSVVAASAAMREVFSTVERVAASMLPVLIQGETGSGKEVVARALHDGSARRGQPLKSINCATIPATLLESTLFGHEKGAFTGADRVVRGVFEQAQGGTVLLDEIGELSPAAQAALLRVLETRRIVRVGGERELEVDVRVLAATHKDLEALADAGTFRWDLLYRLNAMVLRVPPLRERPDDVAALIDPFVAEANRVHGRRVKGLDAGARAALMNHRWPGNVRELKNVVDRAVVVARGELATLEDLPERVRAATARESAAPRASEPAMPAADEPAGRDYKERVRLRTQQYETGLIVEALDRAGGNLTEAARQLQLPVRTLAHKIQQYGIRRTPR